MLEKIQETAAYLKGKMHTSPETAIILGTGLGSLANEITEKYEIKYSDIPNFPVSTVEGHSGKLIFGKLGNKDIMAMQGRFHYYEVLYFNSFFFGNLVSLTNQFLAVCFAHVREARSVRDIFSAKRMFGEIVDMVSDNHQVTDRKVRICAATGIGNE